MKAYIWAYVYAFLRVDYLWKKSREASNIVLRIGIEEWKEAFILDWLKQFYSYVYLIHLATWKFK